MSAHLLLAAPHHRTDLCCAPEVRSAARAPIDAHNGDHSKLSRTRWCLPKARSNRVGTLLECDRNRMCGDHRVASALHQLCLLRRCGIGDIKLDRRVLGAEMDRERLPSEVISGDRGEEVLCGVLLHMIASACSVHDAMHRALRERRGEDVHDPIVVVIYDIDHRNTVECAAIVRLAA